MSKFDAGLTVVEILGLAIKKEIEAARFYRRLAEQIINPLVRERFKALAKDERLHQALLQAEHKRLTGESKPPLPGKAFQKEKTYDFSNFAVEDALHFAIQAEREAQQLYAAAAKASSDPRGKRLLDYLVEFEKGHERQLKGELEYYKKAPLFFEDENEMTHVGP